MKQTSQLTCDLLVAGGGMAGVCCAVETARNGAKVILLQDRPVLGGNASSEIRMHIVGADSHGWRGQVPSVETREGGLMEQIRLETAVRNPQRCAAMFDLVLLEICKAEANLTLLLNTTVVSVKMKDNGIESIIAVRESTEEQFEIAAKIFADCTGDGRLGMEAGADCRRGREAKSEFGESLAQETADKQSLGSSLLFTARKHEQAMPFRAPPWARKFKKSDFVRRGLYNAKAEEPTYEYGHWWFEWGGTLDTIKDNEVIRDELLAILLGAWDYVKNSGDCPGSDKWAMDWFGFVPGKRESRRFIGQHILTQNDLEKSVPFEDAIAYGGWAMDLHPPEGVDAVEQPPCRQHTLPHIYDIPLRSCVSSNIPNLMFAGRNISATHVAFSSTRVMATCAAIGQGVGAAAAVAIKRGLAPSQLSKNREALDDIRRLLLKDDAYLIGAGNDDPGDLTRTAQVRASSETPGGEARQVLSGQTRSVHGERGATPDRARPGLHRWISEASAGLPAWIELEWKKTVRMTEVRLVFDTGLHRELTFSLSNWTNAKIHWGAQPETVKDYDLAAWIDGAWKTIAQIRGNYERLRVHRLESSVETTKFRVTVLATQGAPEARVFEIRVY